MTALASPPLAPASPAAAGPRMRLGKVCVAVQGATPAELLDRAHAALADSRFLEFRLDTLPKPAAALPQIQRFLAERRDVTAIGTCRRKPNGGQLCWGL